MKLRRLVSWSAGVIAIALVGAGVIAYATSRNACDDPISSPKNPMKAVVHCGYGTADVLTLQDVEKPVPADDEVLVKVRAASVNPIDWHNMRGTPYIMRLGTGLRKPAAVRLGVDFAGTVEAVGRSVTRFKPGDEVFGGRSGAFAEYLPVREDGAIARKPSTVTFQQAASVGVAAVTALQGLRDKGHVQAGQRILINGASGGVGTFAVQIAKVLGADVTGVCSTRNLELVRSLGADRVIDYTRDDYTTGSQQYDVIIDNVGNRPLLENKRVLKPDGIYVLIGGGGPDNGRWIGPLTSPVKELLLSPFVRQQMVMLMAELNQKDLTTLRDLMDTRKVTPVVDRQYPLSDVAAAVNYLEAGHARGKVVIDID